MTRSGRTVMEITHVLDVSKRTIFRDSAELDTYGEQTLRNRIR